MNIKEIKIPEIKGYKNNAKRHDKKQIDMIAESIKQFGFRQPIVLDKNNEIVVGHGRFLAAKKIGLLTVPCEYADDLTDDQIKAYRLIDNKLNESPWDFDRINDELSSINFDIADFGFDVDLEEGISKDRIEKETTRQVTTIANANADADQSKSQELSQCKEISITDYTDEAFECECPRCGFKFNRS